MNYHDVPHAAMNELMTWVRKQGKHIVSLHTWSHLEGWSSPPDWSAHIDVRNTHPLHVRIKRKGYQFTIVHEPDDPLCPTCDATLVASLVSHDALVQAAERVFVTQPA